MAPEFQRKLERRLDQAIGEVGRGRLQVLLEHARNALPLGGLKRLGQRIGAHLQPPAGLDRHESTLEIHPGSLHAAQHQLRRLFRHERLISRLQQVRTNDTPVQLDLPFLQSVRHRPGHGQKIGNLLALEPHAFGVGGHEHAKGLQPGVLDLILQIRDDLHLRFTDRRVLKARDLNPRLELLDHQRQGPGRLQNPKG